MDKTETYIKMRLAAIPDLGMGEPPEPMGEEIITGGETYNFLTDDVFVDAKGDWYYSSETQTTQLERQDQLQEMVLTPTTFPRWWLHQFYSWVCSPQANPSTWVTREQLELAFVMKEKYNKVWNGEQWVAI